MSVRKASVISLALGLVLIPLPTGAQQASKVPRIGFVRAEAPHNPFVEAFRQGLRDLGYVEGKNITIEYRWAEGRLELLPRLAADLVRLKVDVIVTGGDELILAVRKATTTIPIVMAVSADAVETGLVASLARPGGNLTGLTNLAAELAGKRLELLKEVAPKASRVAVVWNATHSGKRLEMQETQRAARALGVTLQSVEVRGPNDFERAFSAITKGRADALTTLADPLTRAHARPITAFAARRRMPSIFEIKEFVDAGGLMSYGASISDQYRRAAAYVDKILKGAKPADLPVEQPTRFELVINLKTAKALGLKIPQSILIRADQVIQ